MSQGEDYTDKEVEFIFNKTMTVNEKELIENCKNSMDMISLESILARHPYVNNVDDEKEKIEKEKEEEAKKQESEYDKMIKELNSNNANAKVGDK